MPDAIQRRLRLRPVEVAPDTRQVYRRGGGMPPCHVSVGIVLACDIGRLIIADRQHNKRLIHARRQADVVPFSQPAHPLPPLSLDSRK